MKPREPIGRCKAKNHPTAAAVGWFLVRVSLKDLVNPSKINDLRATGKVLLS